MCIIILYHYIISYNSNHTVIWMSNEFLTRQKNLFIRRKIGFDNDRKYWQKEKKTVFVARSFGARSSVIVYCIAFGSRSTRSTDGPSLIFNSFCNNLPRRLLLGRRVASRELQFEMRFSFIARNADRVRRLDREMEVYREPFRDRSRFDAHDSDSRNASEGAKPRGNNNHRLAYATRLYDERGR